MNINQAFNLLKNASDVRIARIVLAEIKKPRLFNILYICHQLKRGVPVAKIINKKWFYGLEFYTNKYTLDPRPDTETLVEAVIKDKHLSPKILDMGTGSGCIICSCVKNIDGATGIGIDISRGALRVAKRNVKNLELSDKIKIMRAKFNSDLSKFEKFDVIVSNPPYIAIGDERVNDGAMHDPKMALYADNNGLFAYEQIAENAKKYLKKSGKIYLEIGENQETSVRDIFEKRGWEFISQTPDLSGIIRVLIFTI